MLTRDSEVSGLSRSGIAECSCARALNLIYCMQGFPTRQSTFSLQPVFSTGQSVRPEGGRRWTALSGPVRSFSKLALRPGAKDYKPRRPPPSTVKHVSCQGTLPN